MSFVQRQAAHCDVCGHEWLTAGQPTHCAKCKSRKWNSGQIAPILQKPARFMTKRTFNAEKLFHDTKTCRIYKCGMCAAVKDKAKD